mgnify:CR=1 FL=1
MCLMYISHIDKGNHTRVFKLNELVEYIGSITEIPRKWNVT